VRDLTHDVAPGWVALQKELTFRAVPLAPVMGLVGHAQNTRPPWRLTKCVIQASPATPGTGQVVLRFEALTASQ